MKTLRQRHPAAFLVLACYVLCWLAAGLFHTGQLVHNRVLYATGALTPAIFTIDDFETLEMQPLEGGGYVATSADPQFYLKDLDRRVDTLRVDISYSQDPQLVQAFWAAPGGDYSIRRMAYAREEGVLFWLPPGGGQALRLDPGIVAGNEITLHSAVINEQRPAWAFYLVSGGEGALLLAGPGLLACGLSLLPRRKSADDDDGEGGAAS